MRKPGFFSVVSEIILVIFHRDKNAKKMLSNQLKPLSSDFLITESIWSCDCPLAFLMISVSFSFILGQHVLYPMC